MQSSVAVTVSSPPSSSRCVVPSSSACVSGRPSISPCTIVLSSRSSGWARFSSILRLEVVLDRLAGRLALLLRGRRSRRPAGGSCRRATGGTAAGRPAGSPISARKIVDGSGVAKSSWKSHSPLVDELVDDLVDEVARLGLELGHPLRRELRVEQAAVLRVLGRVDRQRDERHVVADVDDVLRREHLGVLERPEHVVVARQRHAVAAEHARLAADRTACRAPRGTRDADRRRTRCEKTSTSVVVRSSGGNGVVGVHQCSLEIASSGFTVAAVRREPGGGTASTRSPT